MHVNCSQPNGFVPFEQKSWGYEVTDAVAVSVKKQFLQMLVQNIVVLRRRGHTWSTATWKIFRDSGLHKPPSQTPKCLHRRSNLHRHLFQALASSIPMGLSLKCFGIRGFEILPKLYRYKVFL